MSPPDPHPSKWTHLSRVWWACWPGAGPPEDCRRPRPVALPSTGAGPRSVLPSSRRTKPRPGRRGRSELTRAEREAGHFRGACPPGVSSRSLGGTRQRIVSDLRRAGARRARAPAAASTGAQHPSRSNYSQDLSRVRSCFGRRPEGRRGRDGRGAGPHAGSQVPRGGADGACQEPQSPATLIAAQVLAASRSPRLTHHYYVAKSPCFLLQGLLA